MLKSSNNTGPPSAAHPLHTTALQLARRGFSVFPCQPRGKTPATASGLLDATTDPARIDGWWRAISTLNLAVATGAVSGCLGARHRRRRR